MREAENGSSRGRPDLLAVGPVGGNLVPLDSVSVMVYAPECEACMGLGAVCSACGRAFPVCECPGNQEPAEGAECEACGGSGEARGE